jgi:ABC-type antimicrobial peptide transport system permease subunit
MRAVTMTEALGESIQTRRFRAWLFGGFAFAALGVAGIGILGMTLMSTARRTREMGLRFALGATRAAVIGGLLREQMTAVVIGLLGGGIVAAWSVRLLKSYLYQFTRRTRASGPSPWRPSR